jgi:hypothetical protein
MEGCADDGAVEDAADCFQGVRGKNIFFGGVTRIPENRRKRLFHIKAGA